MLHLGLFNKYFPIPHFLEMSHSGVHINSTSVHAAEILRTSKGFKLRTYAEEELETPILINQSLLGHKNLIDVLKRIQRKNNLKFVEVSIPEEKSYLFTIDVLDGTNEQIRNRIEMHLEENVPISIDDSIFDYHIIKVDKKNRMLFLAVFVVPQVIIEEYISLFELCNMVPVSFLIENQALAKAVIKRGDKENYLIVNISHGSTVLSIVSDESVRFTSTVSMGSEDLTIAISDRLLIDTNQARFLKYEKGFSKEKDNEDVSKALIEKTSILIEEINKVFTYWNGMNSFKNIKIGNPDADPNITPDSAVVKKILIAGKEAGIIGFKDFLATSLKIPVEVVNVWINIASIENDIPEISMKESLGYGTAFGLALLKD